MFCRNFAKIDQKGTIFIKILKSLIAKSFISGKSVSKRPNGKSWDHYSHMLLDHFRITNWRLKIEGLNYQKIILSDLVRHILRIVIHHHTLKVVDKLQWLKWRPYMYKNLQNVKIRDNRDLKIIQNNRSQHNIYFPKLHKHLLSLNSLPDK